MYSRQVSGLTKTSNNNNGGRVGLLSKDNALRGLISLLQCRIFFECSVTDLVFQ